MISEFLWLKIWVLAGLWGDRIQGSGVGLRLPAVARTPGVANP